MKEGDLLFLEIIQISVGARSFLSKKPTEHEWKEMFATAQKQAIAGMAFDAIEKLFSKGLNIPKELLLEWIGLSEQIKSRNNVVNRRCQEVEAILRAYGYKSCLLKGQGVALYYSTPLMRQSGDIDVWVDRGRDSAIEALSKNGQIGHVDIKHCDWNIFQDVLVEVHFIPTWFYNPFTNKKLQKWLEGQKNIQFEHESEIGINTPTTVFNLVYVLIHIYRHLFDDGIGLRQLMDYYYVILHSTAEERQESMRVLITFRMRRIAGAVMYVLQEVFKLDDGFFMCQPLHKDGQFLLNEIMRAGNFGHYDERNHHQKGRLANGIENIKRNLRFVGRYPQEVCWMPAWKIWHWCWRKRKGYL